jgi:tetratricopeptide (TPR) repeat protein
MPTMFLRRSLPIICALASFAHADDEADRLFKEGRQLIDQGKPDEACAKFEQSFQRDRHAIGTLLNLGLCNERQGKLATAVKHYREVVDHAEEQNNPDAKQAAVDRLAVLVPIVPRVQISGELADGEKIIVDDELVQPGEVELDPGEHHVLASAPGYRAFETHVRAELGKHSGLVLPRLDHESHRRMYGTIGIAAGGALVATSAVVFAIAKHRYDSAFPDHCSHATLVCDHDGQSTTDSARSLGTAGTVIGAVGVVALAAGLGLYFTAPHLEAAVVPTTQGVAIAGRF